MAKVCPKCETKLREAFQDMPMFKLMTPEQAEATLQEIISKVNHAHSEPSA